MEYKGYTINLFGETIWITPKEHTDTLIFMHGLGDTGASYVDVFAEDMNPCPPSTKIVLLTAPEAPVTINGGLLMPSWYDIKEFGAAGPNWERVIGKEEVEKNTEIIEKVLEEEIEALKGKSDRVFLGGFSQGCAMALHVGLGFKKPLAGVVGLSGYLFSFSKISKQNENLPLFLSSSLDDNVVPISKADGSFKRLDPQRHPITRVIENGIGHSFNDRIMKEASRFMLKALKKV